MFFMEASGRIYEPFLGRTAQEGQSSVLEGMLKDAGFHLWRNTVHPGRTMISYGGEDAFDAERKFQGYGHYVRGLAASRISGYEIVARGKDLIDFMEKLDVKKL